MTVLKRTLTVFGLLVVTTAARAGDYYDAGQIGQPPVPPGQTFQVVTRAPAVQGQYYPPAFDGRVGTIEVHNSSAYPVIATLWHPDTGKVFAQWTILPNQTTLLSYQGRPIHVGSDWGMQLGDSAIKPLATVGVWEKDRNGQAAWKTSVDRFFR